MSDLSRFVTRRGSQIEVETLPSTTAPRRAGGRAAFAQVPLKVAADVAKVTRSQQLFIWIWLLHRAWRLKSKTFPVSDEALKQYGISKQTKLHALRTLEAAKLIVVEWGSKSPVVTLVR
jgi:hypothetical protein